MFAFDFQLQLQWLFSACGGNLCAAWIYTCGEIWLEFPLVRYDYYLIFWLIISVSVSLISIIGRTPAVGILKPRLVGRKLVAIWLIDAANSNCKLFYIVIGNLLYLFKRFTPWLLIHQLCEYLPWQQCLSFKNFLVSQQLVSDEFSFVFLASRSLCIRPRAVCFCRCFAQFLWPAWIQSVVLHFAW